MNLIVVLITALELKETIDLQSNVIGIICLCQGY